MTVEHIRASIDRADVMKGDVVIVKRTYFDPRQPVGQQLRTICTRCGDSFPTQFRRMGAFGSARACEVRNIPECSDCRSSYRRKKKADVVPPIDLAKVPAIEWKAGDQVEVIEGNAINLHCGTVHTLSAGIHVGYQGVGEYVSVESMPNLNFFPGRFRLLGRA